MALLNVTELRNGTYFKDEGNIFQVLNYEHIKMGRGSGTVKVKVRNLRSGAVVEKSFITGARVEEAEVEKRVAQYLYHDQTGYHFMDQETFEQYSLSPALLDEQAKFLKEGIEVNLVLAENEVLGVELPNSLIYEVKDTGPEEKGNTVSNVYKEATLDNGLVIKVPMFIKVGEKVKVDTRSGQYVERVK